MLAIPKLESGKRYHIVCQQFPQGCVADGASLEKNTPLYYLATATTDEETYWEFEMQDAFCLIKNAKTGQYITYDGVRQDSPQLRRYVSMSDTELDESWWFLQRQENGNYVIRNLSNWDHIWDVRVDSYCVGTYSNSGNGNQNQQFWFVDETGKRVAERASNDTGNGFDVWSWLDATTDSPDGWVFDGPSWGDPGWGSYSNGDSWIDSPFLERWQSQWSGGLSDGGLSQTIKNLPPGNYTLSADVIAVLQGWNSSDVGTPARGVYLFANDDYTSCSTGSERPENYKVNVTIGEEGTMTLGLRCESTTANWVACDNFQLLLHCTEEEMLEGEKNKIRKELADYFSADEIEALITKTGNDFYDLEMLRKSVGDMAAIDPLTRAAKDFTIDGRALIYVESLDLYLCTLPLENFGQNYTAHIDYQLREGYTNLRIGSREIAPGTDYTFNNVEGGATYKLRFRKDDGSTIEKSITFTSLPVVKMYGTFNNNYQEGSIIVHEPDKGAPQMLNMKAKWRGGITNGGNKHKRNYHVKLLDENGEKLEQKFFGLRSDNSWILESCQVDMSRIRNRVLTDLWNDYASKPYYIDKEPKAKSGTRGRFVELILNDEYRGIYCMTENLDRKQMKLKQYDEDTKKVHGQLWKSKDWSYAVFMGHNSDNNYYPGTSPVDYNNKSDYWDKYNVKYPDMEDVSPTDWSTLYNAVNLVCSASDANFEHSFSDYFDTPVVIDYYILMETILSTDNHGKNMFWAVYDKQKSEKVTPAVWDMDATCGQRWSDDYWHQAFLGPEQDYAEFITRYEHGDFNLFRRLRNTNTNDFNMKVRKRYRDLRRGPLATDSILNRFRTQLDEFKTCGAAQREYDKWSYDSDVAGRKLDFDNEMDYLDNWFTRRMNYLDKVRFKIDELPDAISDISLARQQSDDAVYNLRGQKVGTADKLNSLPAGIYIINGRKVAKTK